jgi:hypothetical protein
MTSQIFKNKNFFTLGTGNKNLGMNMDALKKRGPCVAKYLQVVKQLGLDTYGPMVDTFHFKRIIVDEAHEVFSDLFISTFISKLKKSFGWYVSATPFPTPKLAEYCKRFLEIWEPEMQFENTVAENYEAHLENGIIMSNLVWRNTKESIREEYKVPDYEEHVILTEFHPIEALMHTRKYGIWINCLKLCCGLKGVIPRTLDEQKDWMIEEKQYLINKNKNYCLRTSSDQLMENLLQDLLAAPYVVKGNNAKGKELERLHLRNEYGTKIAKLISWIQATIAEGDSNRFILFSKYDDYLNTVKEVLERSKIPSVMVKGTVVNKSKALKQFREEDVKVVLLSLERSASGMNLIEANYVVLLDPMDGTVEEARAYEIQALGRAHRHGQEQKVTLVRFVIQDSVEEELYLRNKSSRRI